MYRVELKDYNRELVKRIDLVPNVPCGVESGITSLLDLVFLLFLMYRVELKVITKLSYLLFVSTFLMYRVELKERC